jgi:phage terminase large subunit GpA-like protein
MNTLQEILAQAALALRPDLQMSVAEWSDVHRFLASSASAEPGPWRTERTPYLREIMDCLSPQSPVEKVIFMKGAQIGGTEAGNNWIGYVIHHTPGPMLAVQPTLDMSKRWSKQRVAPLIESSPVLRDRVKEARAKDSGNTLQSKEFPGGILVITGANSAAGLRSMPVRFLFLDEVDAYDSDVDGEGDPIRLASQRTLTFANRKIFLVSTPTVQGVSRIEREFQQSDQRRYFVPCPCCGHKQWLQFERLRWEKGQPETVHYLCEGCEQPFEERHKTKFLAEGEWRATAEPLHPGVAGFHINGLYSPLGWLSWSEIARQWEAAQGNDAALKTFKNTVLGETWQERGEAPDWKRLADRKDDYWLGTVPPDVAFLTAGIDIQRDRIEAHIWGWGRGLKSWLVDVRIYNGSTASEEVWRELTGLLSETWKHPSGVPMQLSRLAIDTGDGMTTSTVYNWVRNVGDRRVIAIKGMRGFDRSAPVNGPTFVDVNERGKKIRRGLQLWTVSVSVFKSETYRLLKLEKPTAEETEAGEVYPDGYIHIPNGTTDEWLKQLTAEQLVTVENRRTKFKTLEWQQLRERNEALDCRVYARAAAWRMGVDRWNEEAWENMEGKRDRPQPRPVPQQTEPAVIAASTQPSGGFINRNPGSWLNR